MNCFIDINRIEYTIEEWMLLGRIENDSRGIREIHLRNVRDYYEKDFSRIEFQHHYLKKLIKHVYDAYEKELHRSERHKVFGFFTDLEVRGAFNYGSEYMLNEIDAEIIRGGTPDLKRLVVPAALNGITTSCEVYDAQKLASQLTLFYADILNKQK